ncbi:MAG: hypothetical protein E4G91_06410 [Candidatus Zixiibacteriota bacterium]|nr:MAG: hypothetical protein E4G91_06410 [candidate division Zixibacteria bacterium]
MRTRTFLIILGVAVAISCSDHGTNTKSDDPLKWLKDQLSQTPRENAEAEWAALWLSDALVAPESLYVQIRDDLALLRQTYGDSIRELREIEFVPHIYPTIIGLSVTDSAFSAIRAGLYHEWDSLNQLYGVDSIETINFGNLGYFVYLKSEKRLNADSLADYYRLLPGVLATGSDEFGGDWSNIYPWRVGNQRTYLVRLGSMDCPAGCIEERFWYFRMDGISIEYVGTFYREWIGELPVPPSWWEEAKTAYCKFRHWPSGNCK